MIQFTRIDTRTHENGMVVRYQAVGFEISASRNGVIASGVLPRITSSEDLVTVVNCLRKAYIQYRHMRPNQLDECDRILPFSEEELQDVRWMS